MRDGVDLPAVAAAFGRRLREAGVPVTPDRMARFAQAAALLAPLDRRRLYWAARLTLVGRHADLATFERVFAGVFEAWRDPAGGERGDPGSPRRPGAPTTPGVPARDDASGSGLPGLGSPRDEPGEGGRPLLLAAASREERLADKRFDRLEPAELAAVDRLVARLRVAPPVRVSRRRRRHRRGDELDLRRMLRTGEPFPFEYRRRSPRRRRLVLVCDVSGSMEAYARPYLLLMRGAAGAQAEVFAFATRLTRLTRALRGPSADAAVARAAAEKPDWSGGTRIGDALAAFNARHGRRGLARGAVVVIVSDGWERDDPERLGEEMARLRRLAHRVIWVNPRAASPDYAPLAGGMQAALPHCDAFLSGHSVRALEEVLQAIGDERSPR